MLLVFRDHLEYVLSRPLLFGLAMIGIQCLKSKDAFQKYPSPIFMRFENLQIIAFYFYLKLGVQIGQLTRVGLLYLGGKQGFYIWPYIFIQAGVIEHEAEISDYGNQTCRLALLL